MDIRFILPKVDYQDLFRPKNNCASMRLTRLDPTSSVQEPERLLLQESSLVTRQTLFPEAGAPPLARPELFEDEEDDEFDEFR